MKMQMLTSIKCAKLEEPPTPVTSAYTAPPRADTVGAAWMCLLLRDTGACFRCSWQLALWAVESSCAVLIKLSASFAPLSCRTFLFLRDWEWLIGAPFSATPTVCNLVIFSWANSSLQHLLHQMLRDKSCFDSRNVPSPAPLETLETSAPLSNM